MGASMCGHLLKAGYRATIHNRSRAKAEPLLALGASWSDTFAGVAKDSDIVFTMVGYPRDVRQVLMGPSGAMDAAKPGTIFVDMTTSEPSLAIEVEQFARAKQLVSLDAPVSGGDIGAREARLSIMVGGDRGAFETVRPLFEKMGKTIVWQGAAGSGQHTKMVNQTLIATGIIGVCEALLYAYKSGLNVQTVLESVSGGAAGSWSLTNYAPRILQGNFDPGFYVEHFVKDMGIALAEANRMGLALPGLALAQQLYVSLAAQGGSRLGIQALEISLARMSGIDWRNRDGAS